MGVAYRSFIDDEEGVTSGSLTNNVLPLRIVVLGGGGDGEREKERKRERERGERERKLLMCSKINGNLNPPLVGCQQSS